MASPVKGQLLIQDTAGAVTRITLNGDTADISAGGEQKFGDLLLRDSNGKVGVEIGAKVFGPSLSGWVIRIKAADGTDLVQLGPRAELELGGKEQLGGAGRDGEIRIRDKAGFTRVKLDGAALDDTTALFAESRGSGVVGRGVRTVSLARAGRLLACSALAPPATPMGSSGVVAPGCGARALRKLAADVTTLGNLLGTYT
jgi:hypothetical protein